MYYFLAILNGITLAVMIQLNGELTLVYGAFPSAAIAHLVGLLSALAIYLIKNRGKMKPLFRERPLWLYLGGILGIGTTVFENAAFRSLSVTSLLALALMGETVTALVVDTFGLMGLSKRPFKLTNIPGLVLAFAGMFYMMDSSISAGALAAILLAFASGITVVTSRSVNARLGERIGDLGTSIAVYTIGLVFTTLIAVCTTDAADLLAALRTPLPFWSYLGGFCGVLVVLIVCRTVPHVPAYRLTILTFIGQIFTGVLLDIITGKTFSNTSFRGGLIIAAGIALTFILEALPAKRNDLSQQ